MRCWGAHLGSGATSRASEVEGVPTEASREDVGCAVRVARVEGVGWRWMEVQLAASAHLRDAVREFEWHVVHLRGDRFAVQVAEMACG